MAKRTSETLRADARPGLFRPALALVVLFVFAMGLMAAAMEKKVRPSIHLVPDQASVLPAQELGLSPARISFDTSTLSQARERFGSGPATESLPLKFFFPFLAESPDSPVSVPVIEFMAPCDESSRYLPGPSSPIPFSLPPPSNHC